MSLQSSHAQLPYANKVVLVRLTTLTQPNKVRLSFYAQNNIPIPNLTYTGSDYTIYRKALTDTTWGNPIGSAPGSATFYDDTNVQPGQAYEYRIRRAFYFDYDSGEGIESSYINAYGYCYGGIQVAPIENRGRVILVVESELAPSIVSDLTTLEQDLAGDGWTVVRHDFPRGVPCCGSAYSAQVLNLKSIIKSDYDASPSDTKGLLLLGHLPVPYSGRLSPDGHEVRALPCDAFYAELTSPLGSTPSDWSDQFLDFDAVVGNGPSPRNDNHPNDGRFDNSELPSTTELIFGRIDFAAMTGLTTKTETELVQNYIRKAHEFRSGRKLFRDEAYLSINYIDTPASFTLMWNSAFASFTNGSSGRFFPAVETGSYLLGYLMGAGAPYSTIYTPGVETIATSSDMASRNVQLAFLGCYASYIHDSDTDWSFMRAPLCNENTLATFYAGAGNIRVQGVRMYHFGQDVTIGYEEMLALNDMAYYGEDDFDAGVYNPKRYANGQLQGDPTLRCRYFLPPQNARATRSDSTSPVVVSWNHSSNTKVAGYNVYRASSHRGPFTKLNSTLIQQRQFIDSAPNSSEQVYMVRAMRLEQTGGGSYWNLSDGNFASVINIANGALEFRNLSSSGNNLTFDIVGPPGATVVIEKTQSLGTPIWQTSSTVVLPTSGVQHLSSAFVGEQYFRASAGTIRSLNAIGSVVCTIPTGYSLLSNPFISPDCTVGGFLPNPTSNLATSRFDPWTGAPAANNYDLDFEEWDDPNQVLYPGEALAIQNTGSSFNVNLLGEIPQGTNYNFIHAGWSMMGPLVPRSGALDTTLFYPSSDDAIVKYDVSHSTLSNYNHDSVLGWDVAPVVAVGEGFWVEVLQAKIWKIVYSVW